MTTNPSDTPRTDAVREMRGFKDIVDGDFARQLERELSAMTKEGDEFHRCLLAREESLKRSGEDWVKAKTDFDTLKHVLETVCEALEIAACIASPGHVRRGWSLSDASRRDIIVNALKTAQKYLTGKDAP